MTVHEKARAYELLKKDYELAIKKLESYHEESKNLPTRKDLLLEKENSHAIYYAMLAGAFQGQALSVEFLLDRMRKTLEYHKSL